MEDLFAPASSQNTSRLVDMVAAKNRWKTFTADATRAFWQVPQAEECYIKPPKEWLDRWVADGGDPDVCWQAKCWLYGQRRAPQAWTTWKAEQLTGSKLQLTQDGAYPNIFYGEAESEFAGILIDTHADDDHGTGPDGTLERFLEVYKTLVCLKKYEIHGLQSTYEHLRRTRARDVRGTWIKPSEKHLEKAKVLMNMVGCKGAPTPLVSEIEATNDEDSKQQLLDRAGCTLYRSVVMLLMYYVADIFTAKYAVKELTREMTKPTELSMGRVKRVIRFLEHVRENQWYTLFPAWGTDKPGQTAKPTMRMDAYSDSNWANCRKTRKSTSAGVIQIAGCTLYDYSRTQGFQADASGVAEWYAVVTVTAEALSLKGLLERYGLKVHLVVHTDSSSAKALGHRIGVGKLRSLETKTLWCQAKRAAGEYVLSKIAGKINPPDLGTKAYTVEAFNENIERVGCQRFNQVMKPVCGIAATSSNELNGAHIKNAVAEAIRDLFLKGLGRGT